MADPTQTSTDILLAIGRLEGKMDALVTSVSALHASQTALDQKYDYETKQLHKRVNDLERGQAYRAGAWATLATLASVVINYVVRKFS
jgi:outer membrane murein-binding lipoprotein Lpp